jgi:uncharacterized membrane protein
MVWFAIGLLVFLGVHSVRVFADGWRERTRASLGENTYKGAYSLLSLVGFVLLVYGFSQIRWDSPWLWHPPVAMRHLAALLMLPALVMLVASQVPHNAIRNRLGHPMLLSVKIWALAHLISNGKAADMVLFGAFLIWAVITYRAARQRDRLRLADAPADQPEPASGNTARVAVIGVAVWAGLLLGGHRWLFEVSPLGW